MAPLLRKCFREYVSNRNTEHLCEEAGMREHNIIPHNMTWWYPEFRFCLVSCSSFCNSHSGFFRWWAQLSGIVKIQMFPFDRWQRSSKLTWWGKTPRRCSGEGEGEAKGRQYRLIWMNPPPPTVLALYWVTSDIITAHMGCRILQDWIANCSNTSALLNPGDLIKPSNEETY